MDSVELATWTGAIATLLAVLVALFKEDILQLWHCPKLTATIRLAPPDCHKMETTYFDKEGAILAAGDCFYLRIWVENKGKMAAEQVQVFAAKLERCHADDVFREDTKFLPMNLIWSHSPLLANGPQIYAKGIAPFMGKHCDLGHIVHPKLHTISDEVLPMVPNDQTILALALEVRPSTRSHLIEPGQYTIELKIAAANSKPITKKYKINLTGRWYDDESKMFSDGIWLKEL